ncbi:MAG: lipopolysaccharide biosynthesis protein [Pyrinomonadaceae bacterium]
MIENTAPKHDSLMKQSAWLMFAKVVGFILSALLPLLTVRYLAQDKVGLYRQTFQVITNAAAILPLGFSMSAFYFLNRQPEKRAAAIANILLFNFITGGLACFALFFYPQILGAIFKSDDMTRLAPLIGVVIWLWIFSMFLEVVALANRETKLATVFIISAQLTKTILMTGAVILFTTVEAFIYAAMIQAAVQIPILLVYLNSRFPRFWTKFNFAFFREQLIYALPFGLAGLLYTSQTDIHNYFVGHKFSAADYAIYTTGCFELPLMGMLYESFSAVLIPRMSEFESQNKKREMFTTTIDAMRRLAFAYFPLFIFLMIVADTFITTLFTKNYAASVPIFRVNLLLLPFYCLMLDPIGRAFPAIGRFLLKVRIVLFFALIAALYFGLKYFDLRGMIAIVVVAFAIEKVISTLKISSVLELERKDFRLLETVGKTAIAAATAGIFLFVFYWFARDSMLEICLNFSHAVLAFFKVEKAAEVVGGGLFLGICFALFAAIYLPAANYFGVISADDKAKLANFFNKLTRRRGDKKLNLKLEISKQK